MIPPLARPKRKNPMLRTRQPLLPPWAALARRARPDRGRRPRPVRAAGMRRLRRGAISAARSLPSLPVRSICAGASSRDWASCCRRRRCTTATIRSFASACPGAWGWCGSMPGPTVVVHLHGGCAPPPSRVRVGARLDKSGQGVLLAFPIDEVPNMADDRQLREMTCDPKFRKVLVTDGKTARRPGRGARPHRRRGGSGVGGLRRAVEEIPRPRASSRPCRRSRWCRWT